MNIGTSWRNFKVGPIHCQHAMLVDNGIGDGIVGRHSMTLQESFDEDSLDGNSEWWQSDYMMNIDENVDNLKDYASTTCILEPWNPPTLWRHVSYQTVSNFNAYMHSWRNFNVSPIHCSTCNINGYWHWWWACWKMFHDIWREFRQRFQWWECRMMTMRLHIWEQN